MKQNIASVFFVILSYTIGNVIFCIFKFKNSNWVYKLRLAEVNFLSCFDIGLRLLFLEAIFCCRRQLFMFLSIRILVLLCEWCWCFDIHTYDWRLIKT